MPTTHHADPTLNPHESFSSVLARSAAALFGLVGVILGAGSAHGPLHELLLTNHTLDFWQNALSYQWYHALALLCLSLRPAGRQPIVVLCWTVGTFIFSGTLYFVALNPEVHWARPFAPIGGVLLIAGWLTLLIGSFRRPRNAV